MTKWILHILFSLVLFRLCWWGIDGVSQAMFHAGLAGLDVLACLLLTLFAGLFAWFFGGFLTRKVLDWDEKHGYL